MKDALYALARDHVICMPIADDLATDPEIVEDLTRKLHALLIEVHNNALDEAQRCIGNDHPNTFDQLKVSP